jgi:hypothetical protein
MDKIVAYCDALMVVEILVELPHMKCHSSKKELICKAKMARIQLLWQSNDGNHDH